MTDRKTCELFREIARSIAPPPKLTVSEWADAYRRLSTESSAEAGQWRTDRAPYQREIMDAVSDPAVETVVIMSSAQVGKTEIILNSIGYFIDYDPAPILMIMPTDDMAQSLSKDRLQPMLETSPTLGSKTAEAKSRDTANTIKHKKFAGGHITLIGANSPAQLASRPIRIVFADEIDRFPVTAGREGDPLSLAIKRTTTFWNRKHVFTSTPTIKDASPIEREYNSSTMEEWTLPCPECGTYQPLLWENVKFERDDEKRVTSVGMVCTSCGALSDEIAWKSGTGKWRAEHPERQSKRGFHLNELASPWKPWKRFVEDFLEAKKNPETLKTWVNTSLGNPWEEFGELDAGELIAKRRKMYNCEVPDEALCLTCGVDVQDNRLEYEVVGWGLGHRSWGIRYGVIMGDPGQDFVWEQLDAVLTRKYTRRDGQQLEIMSACVDSGGHYTTEVYRYCRARETRRVWAIKGQGGSGVPFIQRPKHRNAAGVWLFNIGVDVGKDTVTSRLKVEFEGDPGYCIFPMEAERGYDADYFDGLTTERRVTRYNKGQAVIRWEKRTSGARNEPFDIRNYATAALDILNPALEMLDKRLNGDRNQGAKPGPAGANPALKRRGNISKGVVL